MTPEHNPIGEALAVTTVTASILGWLPPIAAALGIAWYLVLLYDRFVKKKHGTENNERPRS